MEACEANSFGLFGFPEVGFITPPKGDTPVVPVDANGELPTPLPPKGDPITLPPELPNCVGGVLLPPPKGDGEALMLPEPNGDEEAAIALPPKGEGEEPNCGEELIVSAVPKGADVFPPLMPPKGDGDDTGTAVPPKGDWAIGAV